MTFSEELKLWRARVALSQWDACKRLGEDIRLNNWRNWEQGRNTPQPMIIAELRRRMASLEAEIAQANAAAAAAPAVPTPPPYRLVVTKGKPVIVPKKPAEANQ